MPLVCKFFEDSAQLFDLATVIDSCDPTGSCCFIRIRRFFLFQAEGFTRYSVEVAMGMAATDNLEVLHEKVFDTKV